METALTLRSTAGSNSTELRLKPATLASCMVTSFLRDRLPDSNW